MGKFNFLDIEIQEYNPNAAHVVFYTANKDSAIHAPISMGVHIGHEVIEYEISMQDARNLCRKMNNDLLEDGKEK
jgi:hypothetical protein